MLVLCVVASEHATAKAGSIAAAAATYCSKSRSHQRVRYELGLSHEEAVSSCWHDDDDDDDLHTPSIPPLPLFLHHDLVSCPSATSSQR